MEIHKYRESGKGVKQTMKRSERKLENMVVEAACGLTERAIRGLLLGSLVCLWTFPSSANPLVVELKPVNVSPLFTSAVEKASEVDSAAADVDQAMVAVLANIQRIKTILTNDIERLITGRTVALTNEVPDGLGKWKKNRKIRKGFPFITVVYRDGKSYCFNDRDLRFRGDRIAFSGFEYCDDDLYWAYDRLVSGAKLASVVRENFRVRDGIQCVICVKNGSVKHMEESAARDRHYFDPDDDDDF